MRMHFSDAPRRGVAAGFTIVELLIVIVVIAILAAITIVAYNGVQSRANNTTTISAVTAYAKAAQLYATQNGTYPISTTYPCLGGPGTKCANTTDGTSACFGAGGAAYQASFDTMIRTVVTSITAPSTQTISCGGKQYAGAYYQSSADGKTAQILYYLTSTTDCGAPGGLNIYGKTTGGNGVQCNGNLPGL